MTFREALAPHQQRVYDEHRDLIEKLNKLGAFIATPIFQGLSQAEKARLLCQKDFMAGYASVLAQRIVAFND